jgi:hypothetical protein
MPTTMANTTTTPAPIAIFFQGFISFRHRPEPFADLAGNGPIR